MQVVDDGAAGLAAIPAGETANRRDQSACGERRDQAKSDRAASFDAPEVECIGKGKASAAYGGRKDCQVAPWRTDELAARRARIAGDNRGLHAEGDSLQQMS